MKERTAGRRPAQQCADTQTDLNRKQDPLHRVNI